MHAAMDKHKAAASIAVHSWVGVYFCVDIPAPDQDKFVLAPWIIFSTVSGIWILQLIIALLSYLAGPIISFK